MNTVEVALSERSYPIFIGSGLLARSDLYRDKIGQQVMVVSNTTVAQWYLTPLLETLRAAGIEDVDTVVLPDGESYKNLETLNTIFTRLLEKRYNRTVTLVALGGGVVGDMTGFAAACYQRGVGFIQMPTTLLSQVDSSVGGKTGVNHALGKNMIGAFYQPRCVLIDLDVLSTLPARELSAGLAEVIKYGLIYDAEFFAWLEKNIEVLLRKDPQALTYAIKRSCEIKAEVVAQDEKENGLRAILNLGHTFGHAIETHQGYGNWLHGEAVGCGMAMASDLSHRLGWLTTPELKRVRDLIERAELPVRSPEGMSAEDFLGHMAVDKKVLTKKLRLVLLRGIGSSIVTEKFDAHLLDETLAAFCH